MAPSGHANQAQSQPGQAHSAVSLTPGCTAVRRDHGWNSSPPRGLVHVLNSLHGHIRGRLMAITCRLRISALLAVEALSAERGGVSYSGERILGGLMACRRVSMRASPIWTAAPQNRARRFCGGLVGESASPILNCGRFSALRRNRGPIEMRGRVLRLFRSSFERAFVVASLPCDVLERPLNASVTVPNAWARCSTRFGIGHRYAWIS
jgi:hypothetical protein